MTSEGITGSDERGLMYGHARGRRADSRERADFECFGMSPRSPYAASATFLHNHDLEQSWYYSHDYWDQYFSMLARNRFNRFNLVFAHQTNYLAPPYPFWLRAAGVPRNPGPRA